ncbi:hypothetical protein Scep_012645 [Stephania cephalantha]|uniref:Uncharacterized protein n=1 Tax=Stephania cephalantha TaxID=152367 RepID=A0AAP0P6N6_9MAGN
MWRVEQLTVEQTDIDRRQIPDNGIDRTTNWAESTQCYQDAQAEVSYCTGMRTSRSGLGMVSSGGSDGSDVGVQRWQWWIRCGVQQCAAAEQLRKRRGAATSGWTRTARMEQRRGAAVDQRGPRASKTAIQWSARHQAATRVTSRMRRRRTVATPGSLRHGRPAGAADQILTTTAGRREASGGERRLADGLQADTRQRADGGDKRVRRDRGTDGRRDRRETTFTLKTMLCHTQPDDRLKTKTHD